MIAQVNQAAAEAGTTVDVTDRVGLLLISALVAVVLFLAFLSDRRRRP